MLTKPKWEIRLIFLLVSGAFLLFAGIPMIILMGKSLFSGDGICLSPITDTFLSPDFRMAYGNSFAVSGTAALVTTLLSLFLACSINNATLPRKLAHGLEIMVIAPMFLPTITYGFAIMYTFGKAGLVSRLFGVELFDIYGFQGMLLGYVIYTLPIGYLLINNSLKYVDKSLTVVSKVMGDSPLKTFFATSLRPLTGTMGVVFIQSFTLCFTDFGIPASIGGKYEVAATFLYNEMLGAVPDFARGASISLFMLLPGILSILLIIRLSKYSFRYNKISQAPLPASKLKNIILGTLSTAIALIIPITFASILIIPFVRQWPYNLQPTFEHALNTIRSGSVLPVFKNSLIIALITAVTGTCIAFSSALVVARSSIKPWCKKVIETIAIVTNTIPGMVLGIAFLLTFSGTALHNSFTIIIICNIIHFFSTPYLMSRNSLEKMNSGWEATGELMGDNWIKTLFRVIIPNSTHTLLEMLGYFFIHSMITISAVIFLAGSRTATITTKIKELQHFSKFDEIFILSLLILVTNITVKILLNFIGKGRRRKTAH